MLIEVKDWVMWSELPFVEDIYPTSERPFTIPLYIELAYHHMMISVNKYHKLYWDYLVGRYREDPQPFLDVLERAKRKGRLIFFCFCKRKTCHGYIAKKFLETIAEAENLTGRLENIF